MIKNTNVIGRLRSMSVLMTLFLLLSLSQVYSAQTPVTIPWNEGVTVQLQTGSSSSAPNQYIGVNQSNNQLITLSSPDATCNWLVLTYTDPVAGPVLGFQNAATGTNIQMDAGTGIVQVNNTNFHEPGRWEQWQLISDSGSYALWNVVSQCCLSVRSLPTNIPANSSQIMGFGTVSQPSQKIATPSTWEQLNINVVNSNPVSVVYPSGESAASVTGAAASATTASSATVIAPPALAIPWNEGVTVQLQTGSSSIAPNQYIGINQSTGQLITLSSPDATCNWLVLRYTDPVAGPVVGFQNPVTGTNIQMDAGTGIVKVLNTNFHEPTRWEQWQLVSDGSSYALWNVVSQCCLSVRYNSPSSVPANSSQIMGFGTVSQPSQKITNPSIWEQLTINVVNSNPSPVVYPAGESASSATGAAVSTTATTTTATASMTASTTEGITSALFTPLPNGGTSTCVSMNNDNQVVCVGPDNGIWVGMGENAVDGWIEVPGTAGLYKKVVISDSGTIFATLMNGQIVQTTLSAIATQVPAIASGLSSAAASTINAVTSSVTPVVASTVQTAAQPVASTAQGATTGVASVATPVQYPNTKKGRKEAKKAAAQAAALAAANSGVTSTTTSVTPAVSSTVQSVAQPVASTAQGATTKKGKKAQKAKKAARSQS